MYGLTEVADACMDWLRKHLMTSQTPTLLSQVRLDIRYDYHTDMMMLILHRYHLSFHDID